MRYVLLETGNMRKSFEPFKTVSQSKLSGSKQIFGVTSGWMGLAHAAVKYHLLSLTHASVLHIRLNRYPHGDLNCGT